MRKEMPLQDRILQYVQFLGGVASVPYRLSEVETYLKGKRLKDKYIADEAGEIAMSSKFYSAMDQLRNIYNHNSERYGVFPDTKECS